MAAYHRTVARHVTNALPAWRAAMASADRLYYITTGTPEDAPALTGAPTHMGNTGAGYLGAGWDVISGYSSGTHIGGLGGAFGSMVYGTGGHKIIANQLLRLNLNEDDPSFSWWQTPVYKTSDTGSADLYYSPSEQATLIAGGRGLAAQIDWDGGSETSASVTRWDRAFPVAFDGWIFPRKMTTGQMGDGAPHGFRYSNQCYLPASITGTDPMLWVGLGPQGPFVQSYAPIGVTDSEWVDAAALSGGSRRWPYHVKNITTGEWTAHQWQPVGAEPGGFGGHRMGVFSDNKRMYVCCFIGGSPSYYYVDFTLGFAGRTISTPVTGLLQMSKYSAGAFSEGDAYGRHFCVAPARLGASTSKITVYDFDTGTSFYVDFAAQGMSINEDNENVGASWDPTNQRVLLVTRGWSSFVVTYWVITPPAGPGLPSSGWTAEERTLTFDDAGMPAIYEVDGTGGEGYSHFYGKVQYLPDLDVILIPANRRRMLGFRPGA